MDLTDATCVPTGGQFQHPAPAMIDFSWAPPLYEHPVHHRRPVRIAAVGAGFSGLCAAIHFQEGLEDFELTIYEKADDVGGVWNANRYPGVACDVPSHSYQFSFAENTQWSAYYAPGREIHQYLRNVASQYDLNKYIKLRHSVRSATWDIDQGQWTVEVEDLATGQVFTDTVDFVVYATGLLSKPLWPNIPDKEEYKGTLLHSGTWDAAEFESQLGFSWGDKRVGVIGAGASAVQIVPYLQKRAKEVINFGRSKVWLASGWGSKMLSALQPDNDDGRNYVFTEKQKELFKESHTYRAWRAEIERDLGSSHQLTLQGNPLQAVYKEKLTGLMTKKSLKKPEVAEALMPDFPVGCKRLTPGPGYIEALCEDNCDLVTTPIERFTPNGIMTADGVEHEFDIIVCATGYNVNGVPGFPIYGIGGVNIQDAWMKESRTYLGLFSAELPNHFHILTHQSAVGSGSQLVVLERQCQYMTKVIAKCQRDGYRSIVPKKSAVDDNMKYADDYFKRAVYSTNCKSWYKVGQAGAATIRSIWPGSGLHYYQALKHPRWEDFEYERANTHDHSMSWLGNGDSLPGIDGATVYHDMRSFYKSHVTFN